MSIQPSVESQESPLVRQRFVWLFIALVVFFVSVPAAQYLREIVNPEIPHVLDTALFAVLLAIVILSAGRSRAWLSLIMALGVPAAVLWMLPTPLVSDVVRILRHVLAIAFLLIAIVTILLLIFATREITLNLLFAALCVYLLLGVVWGLGYSLVEIVSPGAFYCSLPEGKFPAALHMDAGQSAETLYFSFTTLTTLGYGDIMPASRLTRLLAAFEALAGQLYLTVLVARLVGLHIADLDKKPKADQPSGN